MGTLHPRWILHAPDTISIHGGVSPSEPRTRAGLEISGGYSYFAFYTFCFDDHVFKRTVERRLSELSNYPDQSDVLLCFFFLVFFKFLPAKIYLFPEIL